MAASSACLSDTQMTELYDSMKRVVWKVHIELPTPEGSPKNVVYNGVCVSQNGLILCPFLCESVSHVSVTDPAGSSRSNVMVVKTDKKLGPGLLRVLDEECYNYVSMIAAEEDLVVGQYFYSIVYPEKAKSHILLWGQLSCGHRASRDIPALAEACPLGLGGDVSLLQIANLGASNEVITPSTHYHGPPLGSNNHGYAEGRGAPLLNSERRLVGLISFQYSYFDFAIHHSELRKFCGGEVFPRKRKMATLSKSRMPLLHMFGFPKAFMGRWSK